jgi:glycine cleavage system H protein
MSETRYTEEHEYVRVDGDTGTVGITDYAQEQLGDVVYVEVPEVGAGFEKGQEAATVESVKAASEVYSPVSGEVVEVNESLADEPGTVNSDPEGDGWFYRIKLAEKAELDKLMDAAAYKKYVASLED